MIRFITFVVLLASSCDCGFQPVDECPGPRCGTDAGGADGGSAGNDGGTWRCQLPAITPPGPWCTDTANSTRRCSEAALVGQGAAQAVAIDRDRVAWINPGESFSGTVWVATKDGGAPACVARYGGAPGLAANVALAAGFIYWTDYSRETLHGFVMRAPLDGGPAETFSDEQAYPTMLVANDTWVWWSPLARSQLERRQHAGGSTEVFASNQGEITALALDDSHVYWAAVGGVEIRRASVTTGGMPFTWLHPMAEISQLQVKDGFVYWLPRFDAAVYRQATGGGLTTVVASNPASVLGFTTDGERVYWFLDGSSFGSGPLLYAAPIGGPGVQLLAPRVVGGLAADPTALYFGGDSVRRLPK